jgi:hypothetical protein
MFSQIDGSAVRVARESTLQREREAIFVWGLDQQSGKESLKKPERGSLWREYVQLAVGIVLMSAITLGGVEVFARLCANTAMIR